MIALLTLLAAFVAAGAGLPTGGRFNPPRCHAARPDLQDDTPTTIPRLART